MLPITFIERHGQVQLQAATSTLQEERTVTPGGAAENLFVGENVEATNPESDDEQDQKQQIIDLTCNKNASYVLVGESYFTPEPFKLFVDHLYEKPVMKPASDKDCLFNFEAYALGQAYELRRFQNEILQALQFYYFKNTISLNHLFYVVDRWGDDLMASDYLATYIVSQCAYDMACNETGIRSPSATFSRIFCRKYRVAGQELFFRTLDYVDGNTSDGAKGRKCLDPAKDRNNYRHDLTESEPRNEVQVVLD